MRQVRPTILPCRLRMAEMRCRVRSIPAGVFQILAEDARHFPEFCGFASTGPAQDQGGFAVLDNVLNDVYGSVDGATDAAGKADDLALPVANGGDAMQGPFDPGAVILAE